MSEPARCRGCNHRMKRATESGYGPVCERRLRSATGPRIPAPAHHDAIPGQEALPLAYQQVTLWSL